MRLAIIAFALIVVGFVVSAAPHGDKTAAAVAVMDQRVKLAELALEKAEGDKKDAHEDCKRSQEAGVLPTRTVIEAERKCDDCAHSIKVAKVKLEEMKALREYVRLTGELPKW